ncbi:hypothetical protein Ciccas_004049 [Cichlidogyrus casuarinus]|uniref:Uncharacterized protein n=1 Tax=Cichlidogyrus casuarinus TaxID=1844966 RepID=A0ABD2QCM7_9PLAT
MEFRRPLFPQETTALKIERPDSLYSDDEYERQMMQSDFHVIGHTPPLRRLSRNRGGRRCGMHPSMQILLAVCGTVIVIGLGALIIFIGIKQSWTMLAGVTGTTANEPSRELLQKLDIHLATLNLPELEGTAQIPALMHLSYQSRDERVNLFSRKQWSSRLMSGVPQLAIVDSKSRSWLINSTYPWMSEYYELVSEEKRVAISKYLYLFTYGGWFIDSRNICIRPIDSAWSSYQMIFVSKDQKSEVISNSMIASVPRHPLWIEMLRRLIQGGFASETDWLTELVQRQLQSKELIKIKIYPGETYEHIIHPSDCHGDLLICRDLAYKHSANVHVMHLLDN